MTMTFNSKGINSTTTTSYVTVADPETSERGGGQET